MLRHLIKTAQRGHVKPSVKETMNIPKNFFSKHIPATPIASLHASNLNRDLMKTFSSTSRRTFSSEKRETREEQPEPTEAELAAERLREQRKQDRRKTSRIFYPTALAFSLMFAVLTNNDVTAPAIYELAGLDYPPPKASLPSSPTVKALKSLFSPTDKEDTVSLATSTVQSTLDNSAVVSLPTESVTSSTSSTSSAPKSSPPKAPLIPGEEHLVDPLAKRWNPAPWTWYEILKTTFLWTIFPIAPLRMLCIVPCLASSWLLSSIALLGLPAAAKQNKYTMLHPRETWRRLLLIPSAFFSRLALFFAGFLFVHTRGTLSDPAEIPILVANHVSSSDALLMYSVKCATPGFISKAEVVDIPMIGNVLVAMGSLLLDRASPHSRAEVQHEINRRAFYNKALRLANATGSSFELRNGGEKAGVSTGFPSIAELRTEDEAFNALANEALGLSLIVHPGDKEFHHICVFPEGTTTCGKALVDYKLGAFRPGVPIQPVVIHYPFSHFNPTFAGVDGMTLMLRMVSQFYNSVEMEYLPPYYPSLEEQADPKLFARNVRDVMANALNQPTVDIVAY